MGSHLGLVMVTHCSRSLLMRYSKASSRHSLPAPAGLCLHWAVAPGEGESG